MDFLINFLLLGLSLMVLIWGADKFVDNSSIIAKQLGISELTIGLTVVALGTSAPEIFVGISSILNQSEPLAGRKKAFMIQRRERDISHRIRSQATSWNLSCTA